MVPRRRAMARYRGLDRATGTASSSHKVDVLFAVAAHDAADSMYGTLVSDDAHAVFERVFLTVEREDFLAVAGKAHGEIAGQFVRIKDVERAAQVERD